MPEEKKIAVIIGAGPAGLTAAYELVTRTDYIPVILEESDMVGGISRTVNYKGNRMDIGGHRFFSKSDRVMNWWLQFLPLQDLSGQKKISIQYHKKSRELPGGSSGVDPDKTDKVMLVRNRLSRIFYLRRFFDYPIRLNGRTISNLGILRVASIGMSYIRVRLFPIRKEKSLEDFFINRFGRVLYRTFFKDYTEKVWGVPCNQIKPEWGAQRIKGLSVSKALWHALKSIVPRDGSIDQKGVETSLIDRFLYPKFGPGQLWQEVRDKVLEKGAELHMEYKVVQLEKSEDKITGVWAENYKSGEKRLFSGDLFFSTMPVKDLILSMNPPVPKSVMDIAGGLIYRDFIAVGVLLTKMNVNSPDGGLASSVPDNWIYIQESDVLVGRIQVFNNWSPYMVADSSKVWLGLEYFCSEGDDLWERTDAALLKLAVSELLTIGLALEEDFVDGVVVRMPKTYPAYFGTYDQFHQIRTYTDQIKNLFLLGRNGMHKYNNQDHSMLTAMTAVDNIVAGITSRESIWAVNTEEEYHEEE